MKITGPKRKLIDCAIVLFVILILYIFNLPCLFEAIFKIPCPGCGITRAYISLLHLDFRKAFELNFMFWSVPILVLMYFTDGVIFKKKYLNTLLYILIFAGFFINWIFKIFF